ncbi:MAG: FHA domain-containing protein [Nannocystaceae bacterium]
MTVKLQLGNATIQVDHSNPRVLIGRDENTCELAAPDASISRRHAEVYLEGGNVFVRDLGSSNGTWVDGAAVGQRPVQLQANMQVFIGHAPLGVEWTGGGAQGATVMGAVPPEIKALMEARRQKLAAGGSVSVQPAAQAQAQTYAPSGSPAAQAQANAVHQAPGGKLGVGGTLAPMPSDLSYRRQGSNNNGVLLIALKGDTFSNDSDVEGYLEFTATDKETVASIFIELVEKHKKGPKKGHVWDRHLVRQGPWRTAKGDVLPMPFKLRIPPGASISGPECHWELRGYVDIDWALDIEGKLPINIRNRDIEKIRDALGALDYRVVDLASKPLGQSFKGKFQPPTHLKKQVGITDINLLIEYLGTNLKMTLEVEKTKLFKFDKKNEFIYDISKLRSASNQDVSQHFQEEINKLMNK